MKYSIVIPTYNHCDDLLKPCVESIFKHTDMKDVELIISANGCVDNTRWYLESLQHQFNSLGFGANIKIFWSDVPLGYARACNEAIRMATTDRIVLLNNDTVILEQPKNNWLTLLDACFDRNPKCGISCVIKQHSDPAGHDFAVFFCVMIGRQVFDTIGLLNEEYGKGGGEDTEFCIEAERAGFEVVEALEKYLDGDKLLYSGNYPIYHKGEGTVHDASLVPDWNDVFYRNSLKLAKKYNMKWYRWRLSNFYERAVYLKGDLVDPRETTRYKWAAKNVLGTKIFELGATSGYGVQFLPPGIEYTGVDYDPIIIDCAREQNWRPNLTFVSADINTYDLGFYDTIIAFEVIEHLDNGLEIVEKFKKHCKRLLITVPYKETPGFWGPYHKLHMLDESHFPGFEFKYINEAGAFLDQPDLTSIANLMICKYDAK